MIGKAFLGNLAESINPVFIKEMRQYFQNRRMLIFIGALLLMEFVLTLFFSVPTEDEDGTKGVVFFLLIILGGALLSVLICAVGAVLRFSDERSDKELNYAMLTTLKPSSIIFGKLEGALVMLLFIFSMLIPFLTAAYFMRGLSAASLLCVLYIIPVLLLMTLVGILVGSFGLRWLTVIYLVALVGAVLVGLFSGVVLAVELMDSPATSAIFWIYLAVEFGIVLLLGILVFLLAVAVVSPPKSNRLLPAKIYLFTIPILALVIMTPLYFIFRKSGFPKEGYFIIELIFVGCSFAALLLISVFEQHMAGIRVYMKCPRNFLGRSLHFLFSSGFPSTIILAILIMSIPLAMLPFMKFGHTEYVFTFGYLCMMTSMLGFVILSLILGWETKLPLPPWLWLLISCLLCNMGVGFLTAFKEILSLGKTPDSVQVLFMIVSPLYTFFGEIVDGSSKSPTPMAFFLSSFISGILFIVLVPLIVKAFKAHRRPDDTAAIKTPTPEMLKK